MTATPAIQPKLSSSLKALLKYSRSNDGATWKSIKEEVLADLYLVDMSLEDVVSIVLGVYSEAVAIPQFKMSPPDVLLRALILAPIKGHRALDPIGVYDLYDEYSVEDWYNSMLANMMSELRLTTVDWCKEEVWGVK